MAFTQRFASRKLRGLLLLVGVCFLSALSSFSELGRPLVRGMLWRHQLSRKRRARPSAVLVVQGEAVEGKAWQRAFYERWLPACRRAGLRAAVLDLPLPEGSRLPADLPVLRRRTGEACVNPSSDPMRQPSPVESSLWGRAIRSFCDHGETGRPWVDYGWILASASPDEMERVPELCKGRVLFVGSGKELNRRITPAGAVTALETVAYGINACLGDSGARPLHPILLFGLISSWGVALHALLGRVPHLGGRLLVVLLGAFLLPWGLGRRALDGDWLLDPAPFMLLGLFLLLLACIHPEEASEGGEGDGRALEATLGLPELLEGARWQEAWSRAQGAMAAYPERLTFWRSLANPELRDRALRLSGLSLPELVALARRRFEVDDLRGALDAYAWASLQGDLKAEQLEEVELIEGALAGRLAFLGVDELGAMLDPRFTEPRILGQGAMGLVLRCHDRALEREVAVKLLAPSLFGDGEARGRFFREVRALTRLHHPGIVEIFSVHGEEGDRVPPHYGMELIEGSPLSQLLDKGDGPPPSEGSKICQLLAEGLAYVHGKGICHRDLKPENVMLREGSGEPVLIDFGVARAANDRPVTRLGEVLGTYGYMAPEQFEGRRLDPEAMKACDVFSFGVMAWEILNGEAPFASVMTIAAGPREPRQASRGPWVELLRSCLAFRAEARPSMDRVLRTWKDFSSNQEPPGGS